MTHKQHGWSAGEQPEQHYLVQPRALAGVGDICHVFAYLQASGWQDLSAKTGHPVVQSPDRMARVCYNPVAQRGGWMIFRAPSRQQEQWYAVLESQTPVEIVAALTDTFTQPRPAHAPDVWAPLAEQHWKIGYEGRHYTATSPDGTAWMHRRHAGGATPWWTGARDGQNNGWTARFSADTPLHLVAAFSSALASPEPVMRPRGRVPHSARIRTTPVSVLPSQLHAWQQARLTAARARTWPAHPQDTAANRLRSPFARTRP